MARLVTEGLSNREIGRALGISERTVDAHVQHILNKLGFNSRTQVAAWVAVSRGLVPAPSAVSERPPARHGFAGPRLGSAIRLSTDAPSRGRE